MKKVLKITDLSYSFLPHPITGNVLLAKNEDAIKQSIKTLLFLNLYEKPYNTGINVGIKYFLFELMTVVDQQNLQDNIKNILETYETRIFTNDVVVSYNQDNNSIEIRIDYIIIGETAQPDTVTFIFGRSR
jgi:hypothetical protein